MRTSVGGRNERRWRRHRRRVKVTTRQGASYTVDLGPGGLSVESTRVLAPGAIVTGTIHELRTEILFSGIVAWARPGDPYLGLRGRMGVRFEQVTPGVDAPAWLSPEPDLRTVGT